LTAGAGEFSCVSTQPSNNVNSDNCKTLENLFTKPNYFPLMKPKEIPKLISDTFEIVNKFVLQFRSDYVNYYSYLELLPVKSFYKNLGGDLSTIGIDRVEYVSKINTCKFTSAIHYEETNEYIETPLYKNQLDLYIPLGVSKLTFAGTEILNFEFNFYSTIDMIPGDLSIQYCLDYDGITNYTNCVKWSTSANLFDSNISSYTLNSRLYTISPPAGIFEKDFLMVRIYDPTRLDSRNINTKSKIHNLRLMNFYQARDISLISYTDGKVSINNTSDCFIDHNCAQGYSCISNVCQKCNYGCKQCSTKASLTSTDADYYLKNTSCLENIIYGTCDEYSNNFSDPTKCTSNYLNLFAYGATDPDPSILGNFKINTEAMLVNRLNGLSAHVWINLSKFTSSGSLNFYFGRLVKDNPLLTISILPEGSTNFKVKVTFYPELNLQNTKEIIPKNNLLGIWTYIKVGVHYHNTIKHGDKNVNAFIDFSYKLGNKFIEEKNDFMVYAENHDSFNKKALSGQEKVYIEILGGDQNATDNDYLILKNFKAYADYYRASTELENPHELGTFSAVGENEFLSQITFGNFSDLTAPTFESNNTVNFGTHTTNDVRLYKKNFKPLIFDYYGPSGMFEADNSLKPDLTSKQLSTKITFNYPGGRLYKCNTKEILNHYYVGGDLELSCQSSCLANSICVGNLVLNSGASLDFNNIGYLNSPLYEYAYRVHNKLQDLDELIEYTGAIPNVFTVKLMWKPDFSNVSSKNNFMGPVCLTNNICFSGKSSGPSNLSLHMLGQEITSEVESKWQDIYLIVDRTTKSITFYSQILNKTVTVFDENGDYDAYFDAKFSIVSGEIVGHQILPGYIRNYQLWATNDINLIVEYNNFYKEYNYYGNDVYDLYRRSKDTFPRELIVNCVVSRLSNNLISLEMINNSSENTKYNGSLIAGFTDTELQKGNMGTIVYAPFDKNCSSNCAICSGNFCLACHTGYYKDFNGKCNTSNLVENGNSISMKYLTLPYIDNTDAKIDFPIPSLISTTEQTTGFIVKLFSYDESANYLFKYNASGVELSVFHDHIDFIDSDTTKTSLPFSLQHIFPTLIGKWSIFTISVGSSVKNDSASSKRIEMSINGHIILNLKVTAVSSANATLVITKYTHALVSTVFTVQGNFYNSYDVLNSENLLFGYNAISNSNVSVINAYNLPTSNYKYQTESDYFEDPRLCNSNAPSGLSKQTYKRGYNMYKKTEVDYTSIRDHNLHYLPFKIADGSPQFSFIESVNNLKRYKIYQNPKFSALNCSISQDDEIYYLKGSGLTALPRHSYIEFDVYEKFNSIDASWNKGGDLHFNIKIRLRSTKTITGLNVYLCSKFVTTSNICTFLEVSSGISINENESKIIEVKVIKDFINSKLKTETNVDFIGIASDLTPYNTKLTVRLGKNLNNLYSFDDDMNNLTISEHWVELKYPSKDTNSCDQIGQYFDTNCKYCWPGFKTCTDFATIGVDDIECNKYTSDDSHPSCSLSYLNLNSLVVSDTDPTPLSELSLLYNNIYYYGYTFRFSMYLDRITSSTGKYTINLDVKFKLEIIQVNLDINLKLYVNNEYAHDITIPKNIFSGKWMTIHTSIVKFHSYMLNNKKYNGYIEVYSDYNMEETRIVSDFYYDFSLFDENSQFHHYPIVGGKDTLVFKNELNDPAAIIVIKNFYLLNDYHRGMWNRYAAKLVLLVLGQNFVKPASSSTPINLDYGGNLQMVSKLTIPIFLNYGLARDLGNNFHSFNPIVNLTVQQIIYPGNNIAFNPQTYTSKITDTTNKIWDYQQGLVDVNRACSNSKITYLVINEYTSDIVCSKPVDTSNTLRNFNCNEFNDDCNVNPNCVNGFINIGGNCINNNNTFLTDVAFYHNRTKFQTHEFSLILNPTSVTNTSFSFWFRPDLNSKFAPQSYDPNTKRYIFKTNSISIFENFDTKVVSVQVGDIDSNNIVDFNEILSPGWIDFTIISNAPNFIHIYSRGLKTYKVHTVKSTDFLTSNVICFYDDNTKCSSVSGNNTFLPGYYNQLYIFQNIDNIKTFKELLDSYTIFNEFSQRNLAVYLKDTSKLVQAINFFEFNFTPTDTVIGIVKYTHTRLLNPTVSERFSNIGVPDNTEILCEGNCSKCNFNSCILCLNNYYLTSNGKCKLITTSEKSLYLLPLENAQTYDFGKTTLNSSLNSVLYVEYDFKIILGKEIIIGKVTVPIDNYLKVTIGSTVINVEFTQSANSNYKKIQRESLFFRWNNVKLAYSKKLGIVYGQINGNNFEVEMTSLSSITTSSNLSIEFSDNFVGFIDNFKYMVQNSYTCNTNESDKDCLFRNLRNGSIIEVSNDTLFSSNGSNNPTIIVSRTDVDDDVEKFSDISCYEKNNRLFFFNDNLYLEHLKSLKVNPIYHVFNKYFINSYIFDTYEPSMTVTLNIEPTTGLFWEYFPSDTVFFNLEKSCSFDERSYNQIFFNKFTSTQPGERKGELTIPLPSSVIIQPSSKFTMTIHLLINGLLQKQHMLNFKNSGSNPGFLIENLNNERFILNCEVTLDYDGTTVSNVKINGSLVNYPIVYTVEQFSNDTLVKEIIDPLTETSRIRLVKIDFDKSNEIDGYTCTKHVQCPPGQSCLSGNCKDCWPGCNNCISPFDINFVSQCSFGITPQSPECTYLSDFTSNSGESCPLKYLNLGSLSNSSFMNQFNFREIKFEKTSGFSFSFWINTTGLSDNPFTEISINHSYVKFDLSQFLSIKVVGTANNNIAVIPRFYNYNSNETISFSPSYNGVGRWVNIKFGFLTDLTYKIPGDNSNYNSFVDFSYVNNEGDSIINSNDFYINNKSFQNDFRTHKRIVMINDELDITISSLFIDNTVDFFLREFAVFKDFVRSSYEEFSLRETFSSLDSVVFYLPLDDFELTGDPSYPFTFEYFKNIENWDTTFKYLYDEPLLNFNTKFAHSRTPGFIPLHILPANNVFAGSIINKKLFTPTNLMEKMVNNNPPEYKTLFCKDDSVMQYNMIKDAPVYVECVKTCAQGKLCSNNCHSGKNDCLNFTTCPIGMKLFDNDCIMEINDPIHHYGAFYYNNIFKTPDTVIELSEIPTNYIFTFYYLPEFNNDFRASVSTTEMNYILYTNKFIIYIKNTSGSDYSLFIDYFSKEEDEIDLLLAPIVKYTTKTVELTTFDVTATKYDWIDFTIMSQGVVFTVKSDALNINNVQYRIVTVVNTAVENLNKIAFVVNGKFGQDDTIKLNWYPGFYTKLEIFDSDYSNIKFIESLRTYFSIWTPTDRMITLNDTFPYFRSLQNQLTFSDIMSNNQNSYILSTSFPNKSNITRSFLDVTQNYYQFNYSAIDQVLSPCDEKCKKCFANKCYECHLGFALNTDGKCSQSNNPAENLYYLRSPKYDYTNTEVNDASFSVNTSDNFIVNLYVKFLSVRHDESKNTSQRVKIFSIGNLDIEFVDTPTGGNLILVSGGNDIMTALNFRNGSYNKWINLTVAVYKQIPEIVFTVNYAYFNTKSNTIDYNLLSLSSGIVIHSYFIGLIKEIKVRKFIQSTELGILKTYPYLHNAIILPTVTFSLSSTKNTDSDNCATLVLNSGLLSNSKFSCIRDLYESFVCENNYVEHNHRLQDFLYVEDYQLSQHQRLLRKSENYFGSLSSYPNNLLGNFVSPINSSWLEYINAATYYDCELYKTWDLISTQSTTGAIPGYNVIDLRLKTTIGNTDGNVTKLYFTLYSKKDINTNIYFSLCNDDQVFYCNSWVNVLTISSIKANKFIKVESLLTFTKQTTKFVVNGQDYTEDPATKGVFLRITTDQINTSFYTKSNNVLENLRLVKLETFYDVNTSCTTDGDCLDSQACIAGNCKFCFPGCNNCTSEFTTTSTTGACTLNTSCSYLSNFTTKNTCNLEYLNMASMQTADNSALINEEFNGKGLNALTLGFWIFSNEITDSKLRFQLSNYMDVFIENVNVSNPKVYKTFMITTDIFETKAVQRFNSESSYEKWTHIKVGFHFDMNYQIDGENYNGFIDTVNFTNGKPLYTKWDFYKKLSTFDYRSYKMIYKTGDKFKFALFNQSKTTTTDQIILRNIVVFNDFVRTDFQDYDLINMTNISYLYFYIPLNDVNVTELNKSDFTIYSSDFVGNNKLSKINSAIDSIKQHPTSNKWHRLNLLEVNSRFEDLYLNQETYTCDVNVKACIKLGNQPSVPILCGNGFAHQYDEFRGIPVKSSCVDKCAEGEFCSHNCHYEKVDCNSKICVDTNKRWFDNKCIHKNSDELYYKGALYHSNYFRTPEFYLEVSASGLSSYIISFWYFSEFESSFLYKTNLNDPDFKHYIFYSDNVHLYVQNNKTVLYLVNLNETTEISSINFSLGMWINFVFDITEQRVNIKAKAINIDYSKRLPLGSALTITKITFKQFTDLEITNKSIWLPGYYKYFESYDNSKIDMTNYSLMKIYYNDFSNLRPHMKESFPNHLGLRNSIYFNDKQVTTNNLYSNFNWGTMTNSEFLTTYLDNNTQIKFTDLPPDTSNVQKFNYGIVDVDILSMLGCPENCAFCGGNECFKCKDEFILDIHGKCERTVRDAPNRFVFRSPIHFTDNGSNNDNVNVVFNVNNVVTNTFTFSIYVKILGFTTNKGKIFSLGALNVLYDYSRDSIILETPVSGEIFVIGNFRKANFSKWVNFSIGLNKSHSNDENWKLDFYVNYSYFTIKVNTLTGMFNINNEIIQSFNFNNHNNVVISHEFIGLVSHANYIHNKYIQPAFLLNENEAGSLHIPFYSRNSNCLDNLNFQNIVGNNKLVFCVNDFEDIDYSCVNKFKPNVVELAEYLLINDYEKNSYMQKRQILETSFGDFGLINNVNGNFISRGTSDLTPIQIGTLYTCAVNQSFDIQLQESVGVALKDAEDIVFKFNIALNNPTNYEVISITYYLTEDLAKNTLQLAVCKENSSDNRCELNQWSSLIPLPDNKANNMNKIEFSVHKRSSPTIGQSDFYVKFDTTIIDIATLSADGQLIVAFSDFNAIYNSNRRFLIPLTLTSGKIQVLRLIKFEKFILENELTNATPIANQNFLKSDATCTKDSDCLNGYVCELNSCKACFAGCSRCNSSLENNNTGECLLNSQCSYLSNFLKESSPAEKCYLDYVNFNQFSNIEYELPSPPKKAAGFTLGFWMFTSPLKMNDKEISFDINIADIMNVNLSNVKNSSLLSSYDTVKTSVSLYGYLRDSKSFSDSVYGKWVHYKVGYHAESTYQIGDEIFNGFIDTVYYNNKGIIRNKNDFFAPLVSEGNRAMRKIFGCNQKSKFGLTRNGDMTGQWFETFFREITVFKDYIRTNFEEYELKTAIEYLKPLYFIIPFNDVVPSAGKLEVSIFTIDEFNSVKGTSTNGIIELPITNYANLDLHPKSPEFVRLNIFTHPTYDSNSFMYHFKNKYFEFEKIECPNDSKICVNSEDTKYNVFCNYEFNTMQYFGRENYEVESLKNIPVKTTCRNSCEDKKLCSNLCKSYEVNCTSKCTDSANFRWMDGQCYKNDNESVYRDAALYYNYQFPQPPITFYVKPSDSTFNTNNYILSIWTFFEKNDKFYFGTDGKNKLYILMTDAFNIFRDVSENKVKLEMSTTDNSPIEIGSFESGEWFNIVVHSKDTKFTVNRFAWGQSEITLLNSFNLGKITFPDSSSLPLNTYWQPTYYKHLEVIDSSYYTNDNYLEFRTNFNIYENNKFKLRDEYPKLHNHYINWPMTSWFVTDPLKHVTNDLISEFNPNDDYINKYYLKDINQNVLKQTDTCENYNNYYFNYSTVKENNNCSDNCESCNKFICLLCQKNYYLNSKTKLCERIVTTRKTYLRSPLTDYANPMFTRNGGHVGDLEINFLPPTETPSGYDFGTPYEFTFSVFLKPLGFTEKTIKVMSIGEVELSYQYENNNTEMYWYLTPKHSFVNGHTNVVFKSKFDYPDFGKWTNFSFSFYRNFLNGNKIAPTMLTYQYKFNHSEHFVLENEDLSYNTLSFNKLVLHKDYVGLIANFRYIHRYIYQPSNINNGNNYPNAELYILPFAGNTEGDCLRLRTSNNDYNSELISENQDTLKYMKCVEDNTVEFFNSCDKNYTKIKQVANVDGSLDNFNLTSECIQDYSNTEGMCEYSHVKFLTDIPNSKPQCSCVANSNEGLMWRDSNNKYTCVPNKLNMNLLAYTPVQFTDYNNFTQLNTYAFESWIYLQAYNASGMKGFSFKWRNHLTITIDQTNTLNNFDISCHPKYLNNSRTYNVNSNWIHFRCDVNLDTNKFLYTSNIYESSEQNLDTTLPINYNNQSSNLIFEVENERYLASGRLYVRQLRLWNCYYCHHPNRNYRLTINDNLPTHLPHEYFTNLVKVYELFDSDGVFKSLEDMVIRNELTSSSLPLMTNTKYFRLAFDSILTLRDIIIS
jgi:hypothetical protein